MNKRNLELLGLGENATKEDITKAYEELRAKYLEERFLDGEAGNNAAKMLNKIEVAYSELMNELNERHDDSVSGDSYEKVEELIRAGKIDEAQRALDAFNERGAQWHYLQGVVFYRKNWMNESKKQLEIALNLEPDNEKFKDSYRKLKDKMNSAQQQQYAQGGGVYQGQTVEPEPEDQMGGNFCAQCIRCCMLNLCINCACNSCCR